MTTVEKIFEILKKARVDGNELYIAAGEILELIHNERNNAFNSVFDAFKKEKADIK